MNVYGRQLTRAQIEAKEHRDLVGGLWDELGALQFAFLKGHGLLPAHRMLDIGCGALRGGVHFVRYLDPGHYCGIDINESLIQAGRRELQEAGIADRNAQLAVSESFDVTSFGSAFEYVVAISVFTHLTINEIVRCLGEVRRVLSPTSVFFASYFEAPTRAFLSPIRHFPGGIETRYDADPYHYAFEELRWLADAVDLEARNIGDWNHPRAQRMAAFSLRNGTGAT